MGRSHCEKEQLVVAAASQGTPDAALSVHLTECAVCTDAALVAEYMAKNAASVNADPYLPDPGLVWLRAQFRVRDAAVAKAIQPIAVVTKAGSAGVALAGLWFSSSPAARDLIAHVAQTATLHSPNVYWSGVAVACGIATAFCALISSVLVFKP